MKDEQGFEVLCEFEHWEIYNNREDKDYICRGEGNYGWFCAYAANRDKCPYYKPKQRKKVSG